MLEVIDATVTYGLVAPEGADEQERRAPALAGVSAAVAPGELVAFIGRNGSGKSTLARVLCGAQALDTGTVRVTRAGAAPIEDMDGIRRLVGLVGQNPLDQAVSTEVLDEVAFGPRNLGLDEGEVRRRVERALAAAGIEGLAGRQVVSLSGGELQRLALAGILAMQPEYLVLDEVTAQLDSACRPALRRLFRALAEGGAGVALVTHDPIEVLACDRVVALDGGRVVWEGTPRELLMGAGGGLWDTTLIANPYVDAVRRCVELGYDLARGTEPEDLAAWLSADAPRGAREAALDACGGVAGGAGTAPGDSCGAIRVAGARVELGGTAVLEDADLAVGAGEVLLVAGRSGAGKTTLACLVAGLVEPSAGTVEVLGRSPRPGDVGLAFQNPEQQFFLESVEAELAFAPRNLGLGEQEVAERVGHAVARLGLDVPLAADPFALSGGQARRVALASVITMGPGALVLDEPTAGLDAASRASLHRLVASFARAGLPVIVVSHDLEEWLPEVDRVAVLAQGRIVWTGVPRERAGAAAAFRRAGMEPPESWRLAEALDGIATPEAAPVRDRPPHAAGAPAPSPLGRIDARVKIVLLLIATVAVFAAHAPWALAFWAVLAAAALAASGASPKGLVRTLRPVAVLLVFIVCANLVSCDGSGDIALMGPVWLSTAGAARAGGAVARIVLLVCLALAVSSSTTPTALAEGCVRLMRPLARAGVPVGDVGLMLSMALRFIPLVSEEVQRIRLAQTARGAAFDEGSVLRRVRAWASVLTPVVVGLFRRADRVAESMDARLYGSSARRGPRPMPLDGTSRAVLALGGALMVLAIIMSWIG